ncbi:MAG: hypothetical protein KC933_06465 [Myxococcales bacterium]|nr:hypothetical protein [Myxococcales bacterium]MCB9649653.1 quinol:cytochrome C oxidoreductase [Deltaproteobacteria bacterium]
MSTASKTLDANDARLSPFEGGGKMIAVGFGLGAVGLGGAAALGAGAGDHFEGFLHSYLVAFAYFLAIALGGLFFVTLQHLTRAGWSVAVRRLAEVVAGTLPVLALLSLPIVIPTFLGNHALYHWADPAARQEDHLLHHKEAYLNNTFFLIRMVVFFGFWSLLARYFLKNSTKQDETGDPEITTKQQKLSAPAMILFALTLTYGAVDLLMSLVPHWFSTIIGVYYFAGAMMSAMATLIVLAKYLQGKGKLGDIVTVDHYHDLGKLMFAFTFFWAYIAFSQFMLIWYGNIPEDTIWYAPRQVGQWIPFSIALILVHFAIPFVGVMSRHAKRKTGILLFWAIWLLFAHWMDMFYVVKPTMIIEHGGEAGMLHLSLMDPLCWVGVLGFFIAAIGMGLKKHRLVPVKDPRLTESLAFENY